MRACMCQRVRDKSWARGAAWKWWARLPPHAERAIEGNLLFESLSLPAKQAIIRSMAPQLAAQGEVIIAQVRVCVGGGGRWCLGRQCDDVTPLASPAG